MSDLRTTGSGDDIKLLYECFLCELGGAPNVSPVDDRTCLLDAARQD